MYDSCNMTITLRNLDQPIFYIFKLLNSSQSLNLVKLKSQWGIKAVLQGNKLMVFYTLITSLLDILFVM